MIIAGFTDLTKRFFDEFEQKQGTLPSQKDIMDKFLKLNPSLDSDKIFKDILPTIYQIGLCERMIKQQEKEKEKEKASMTNV